MLKRGRRERRQNVALLTLKGPMTGDEMAITIAGQPLYLGRDGELRWGRGFSEGVTLEQHGFGSEEIDHRGKNVYT